MALAKLVPPTPLSAFMPRFVVLTHDHPFLHWDFMLEEEVTLRTWRLLAEPTTKTDIMAELLPDHRKHYLDYEGPVNNNRGIVTRWDAGTYQSLSSDETCITVRLEGSRLNGIAELNRQSDSDQWAFHLKLDETRSAV